MVANSRDERGTDNACIVFLHGPRETQRMNSKRSKGKGRGWMSCHRARELPQSWGPWVGKGSENVLEERRFKQDLSKKNQGYGVD